jgi:hypothetical protein
VKWFESGSPRLWRHPYSHFAGDETLHAADTYTDPALARIAEEGFTGIWLFGALYDVMRSEVLPELNRPDAERRIASVQTVAERARQHGLGVFVYFNEPMGVAEDHAVWLAHPETRGVRHWNKCALCWAEPKTRGFLREAARGVLEQLPDIAGVILITAGEDLTHCWAKRIRKDDGSGCECPRCAALEPADIVTGQIQAWAEASAGRRKPFRVLAWNWEWAYWYGEPHAPIVDRLPAGVELLLDLEFGGERPWRRRMIPIGEYSISYVGPGKRFVSARTHAGERGIPVHAKVEINVSHELASVPNVPLLPNIHGKLKALSDQDAAGFLGCWAIGSSFTLNTHAVKLFLRDPHGSLDTDAFLDRLARDYFGLRETERIRRAWAGFCEAFLEYPFSTAMLYLGPQNDAPARPLSLRYEGKPACASWTTGPLGDDLSRCFGSFQNAATPFTPEEIVSGFGRLSELWAAALPGYQAALADNDAASDEHRRRRREESDCARMIGIQLASTVHVLRFYLVLRARIETLNLTPPCNVPPTPEMLAMMADEISNAARALSLVERDSRLGFHQSCQAYKYDAATIRLKMAVMRDELRKADRQPC